MKKYTFTMIMMAVTTGALLLAITAFASQGEGINFAAIRQQNAVAIKLVRMEGSLSCDLGAKNTGSGCELKFQTKNGRVYNLTEASNAMRLFQEGSRQVAIEGQMKDSDTIQVKTAQNL